MSSTLTNEDYSKRKKCLEDLKKLVKSEQEQIYTILKKNNVEYSENSNGVFFDLSRLSNDAFEEIIKFLDFCNENRKEFESHLEIMENSRLNLSEGNSLE